MLAGIIVFFTALVLTGYSAPTSPAPTIPSAALAAYKTQLRAAVEQLWTGADTNHDGRFEASDMEDIFNSYDDNGNRQISKHEFEEHFDSRNDSTLDIVADALFIEIDMDGDNEISGSDIQRYYLKIDEDNDKTVEKQEFVQYFEKVLTLLYVVEYQAAHSSPIPGVGK